MICPHCHKEIRFQKPVPEEKRCTAFHPKRGNRGGTVGEPA